MPRSRLYSLQPIGIGTWYAEGLTSYIARLAQTHCVTPGTLISGEIGPKLSCNESRYGKRFYEYASKMNGVSKSSIEFVFALDGLTVRKDLRFLTLAAWSEVLQPRDLIKTQRAWCPECYQEWQEAEQEIYDPLLWSINDVNYCTVHKRQLLDRCPHCGSKQPIIGRFTRPGFCDRCYGWLGSSEKATTPDAGNVEWEIWVAQNIGELIVTSPELNCQPSRDMLSRSLILIQKQAPLYASDLDLPKSSWWECLSGNRLPSLKMLLRLCRYFSIPLADFMLGHQLKIVALNGSLPATGKAKRKYNRIELGELEGLVRDAVYSGTEPPPSITELADRLGCSKKTLYNHFPELSRAITTAYMSHRKKMGLDMSNLLEEKIRDAVLCIHQNGYYPSKELVEKMVTPGVLHEKFMSKVWHDALHSLGWG